MDLASFDPSRVAVVASLALVPVGAYAALDDRPVVALSLVSVLVVAASVYVLFAGEVGPVGVGE